MPLRLLLIDNYDSYTYNLSHLLALANNKTPPTTILSTSYPNLHSLTQSLGHFDAYILSPGPGSPHNARDFPLLERELLLDRTPLLGVCLGHQALCAAYGAKVERSPGGPVHGAVSVVVRASQGHDCPLFRGVPSQFKAVRYHSLAVKHDGLNECLLPTAWTVDGGKEVLMAVRHRDRPLFGVQFHPESVGTAIGMKLAANFVRVAAMVRGGNWIQRPLGRVEHELDRSVLRKQGRLKTVVKKVEYAVDAERIFTALYANQVAFWLDSSSAVKTATSVSRCSSPVGDESRNEREEDDYRKGRFSIMGGCDGPLCEVVRYDVTRREVRVEGREGVEVRKEGIFEYLEERLKERYVEQPDELPVEMNGGYVGFLGYELKGEMQGVQNRHQSGLPDAWFVFADRFVVFDHAEECLYLVAVVDGEMDGWFERVEHVLDGVSMKYELFGRVGAKRREVLSFVPERSRREYLEDIRECLREIDEGESYEVCLTNRLRTKLPPDCDVDALDVYLALRMVNPAPYAAFLRLDDNTAVCCSSPERYLRISAHGAVESKPIKGTLPRGRSLQEDEELRVQLENSPKDRRENLMIVDLVRNDLSRTCAVGSVQVPKLMKVESYATVHQLVSTVTGVLRNPAATVACVRAAYPMGSMTGAPKVRTMEVIDRLERSSRGIYSGSIGYLSLCGAADLNVVIRTAVVTDRDVEIGVGGAIVALSNPNDEYEEVILKGRALMQTLALTMTGRSDYLIQHEESQKA